MGKYTHTPRNMKRNTAIVLMALVLILGAIGFAAAKYVSSYRKEAEIHASTFHFSSDYLAYSANRETAIPEFTVSDWGRSIQFHLYNYEKENVALISDTDIVYTVSVSKGWDLSVSDSQGSPVKVSDGSYTLRCSDERTYHLVTLTYRGIEEVSKVDVTVCSSRPYTKEMKATFIPATDVDITYTVTDMGHYAVVTICTNQYSGPISINWNNAYYSPDNTNELMSDWLNTASSGTISDAKEFTTYTLIFLENQEHTYQKADFTITGA